MNVLYITITDVNNSDMIEADVAVALLLFNCGIPPRLASDF